MVRLQSETVAGIEVRSAQSAVVTLLTMINGKLMEFGVPVYTAGGGIVISGLPTQLQAPPKASLPQSPGAQ